MEQFLQESIQDGNCYLTDIEIRRLHRRFGHPSAYKFHRVLQRAGYDYIAQKDLDNLTKLCEHCQKHGKSPGRFKFNLREDAEFNHSIIVDVMYINGKPVLHIVDEGTRFQAAQWLDNVSAKHTWDKLRMCWIDTYIGPPDYIVHDAGKNFVAKEFIDSADAMGTATKSVPVEAHWSVGLVERCHYFIRRAYAIIENEMKDAGISKEMMLQMSVKAVNDSAGPDGITPTLLVFGHLPAYDKLRSERQVSEALKQRNGPSTTPVHDLPPNSLEISGVDRSLQEIPGVAPVAPVVPVLRSGLMQVVIPEIRQTRAVANAIPLSVSATYVNDDVSPDFTIYLNEDDESATFATTPDTSMMYQESRKKELQGLMESGVFELVKKSDIPLETRIFNSRFVDEIKNEGTDKAFPKSRLVVQAWKDQRKEYCFDTVTDYSTR
ncbi:hypothetical protein DID88_005176 [Monilinia fructigena]|uniref:Integrase catalytic domain-containing protein n=1 Tax=Monilinia fructigena TaxID=38457 RepID=A0A395IDP0_9HELO|nr:hypothetical protein DID88_005176 [Monilinia fructigena]